MVLPLRMSTDAFAMSWADADGVDQMPASIFVPTWAENDEALAQRYVRAARELAPLVEAHGEDFFVDLNAVYRCLATAPLEYRARVQRVDGSGFGAMVACHGKRGFRAIVDGDVVEIAAVPPGPEPLVDVLPGRAPAPGPGASAPMSAVLPAADDAVLFRPVEHATPDVAALRKLLRTDPVGKGQLTVAVRTGSGRRHVHPEAVNYGDLETGRVVYYRDGDYLTALPGTDNAIVDRLVRLSKSLA